MKLGYEKFLEETDYAFQSQRTRGMNSRSIDYVHKAKEGETGMKPEGVSTTLVVYPL